MTYLWITVDNNGEADLSGMEVARRFSEDVDGLRAASALCSKW